MFQLVLTSAREMKQFLCLCCGSRCVSRYLTSGGYILYTTLCLFSSESLGHSVSLCEFLLVVFETLSAHYPSHNASLWL